MAPPEVGGRQRRHEELLVLPVIRRVALDLPAAHRRQLARLRLDDFAASDVLDRLKAGKEGGGCFIQNSNIVNPTEGEEEAPSLWCMRALTLHLPVLS